MQHGQIYPKTGTSELCNLKWCLELNKLCDITPKLGRQQKREAARTDIARNRAAGWLQKQSHQQKCDAARTDIARNRAAGLIQKQSRQQKRERSGDERREGRVRKTGRNFRVFPGLKHFQLPNN